MIQFVLIFTILILMFILVLFYKKCNNPKIATNLQKLENRLDDTFDKDFDVKYINLDSSILRNKKIVEQLKNKKFKFSRFSAYDGRKIDKHFSNSLIDNFKTIDFNGSIYKNKKGSLGNFISQLTCWYDFYTLSDKKFLIVMEDDVLFSEKLNKKLIYKTINSIKVDNWDLIKFFHFGKLRGEITDNTNTPLIKTKSQGFSRDNTGMQFYCIKKESIKKLINLLLPIKNITFDMKVKEIMNKSNIFITKEKYVSTEPDKSDRKNIDTDRTLKVF